MKFLHSIRARIVAVSLLVLVPFGVLLWFAAGYDYFSRCRTARAATRLAHEYRHEAAACIATIPPELSAGTCCGLSRSRRY